MARQVEHWFNHKWAAARRDVYLLRIEPGWQARRREGGNDRREVVYDFDLEHDARAMVEALKAKIPPELRNWSQVTERQPPPTTSGD